MRSCKREKPPNPSTKLYYLLLLLLLLVKGTNPAPVPGLCVKINRDKVGQVDWGMQLISVYCVLDEDRRVFATPRAGARCRLMVGRGLERDLMLIIVLCKRSLDPVLLLPVPSPRELLKPSAWWRQVHASNKKTTASNVDQHIAIVVWSCGNLLSWAWLIQ